jgi:hypothetical protein
VTQVAGVGRSVHVVTRTCASEAACTGCGVVSRRVHSSYQRQLADTASGRGAVTAAIGHDHAADRDAIPADSPTPTSVRCVPLYPFSALLVSDLDRPFCHP